MLISLYFAAAARTCVASGVGLFLLLLPGCAGLVPQTSTRAADPVAGTASAPPPSVLGMDDSTRKTQQLLAASGATRLEGLKPMKHGMSMDGMDHQGMKGMKGMPGMDHSKMPEMQKQPGAGTPARQQHSGGMEGMDHSKMPGMDHSKMPEMQKPPTTGAPARQQQPGGREEMDHSKMPGMDHSQAPGTMKSGGVPDTTPPKQSSGTPTGHDAHAGHGDKHTAPSSPVAQP